MRCDCRSGWESAPSKRRVRLFIWGASSTEAFGWGGKFSGGICSFSGRWSVGWVCGVKVTGLRNECIQCQSLSWVPCVDWCFFFVRVFGLYGRGVDLRKYWKWCWFKWFNLDFENTWHCWVLYMVYRLVCLLNEYMMWLFWCVFFVFHNVFSDASYFIH